MRPTLYDLRPTDADWYWRRVAEAPELLDESELETGMPPSRTPHVFAESMSVYAQDGGFGAHIRDHLAARKPHDFAGLRKNNRQGLGPDVMDYVEAKWAALPNWDDLAKVTAR